MASAPPSAASGEPNIRRALIGVVDRVPATRGIGVTFIDFGRLHRLRKADAGEATVVFERRPRPIKVPPLLARAPTARHLPTLARSPGKVRTAQTSPATEWINLGLNCGGAALAWIGVVGMGALAPVTGGVSGFGAVILYGGAAAATGQCVVSVARTVNLQRGRTDINQRWDNSKAYVRTMQAADGVSLIGAGGALRQVLKTNAVLRGAGYSVPRAGRGEAISRPMRRRLTTMLELQGAARVSGVEINRVVRQHLLDGAAGVLGLFASSYSGLVGDAWGGGWDLVVWITEETGQR